MTRISGDRMSPLRVVRPRWVQEWSNCWFSLLGGGNTSYRFDRAAMKHVYPSTVDRKMPDRCPRLTASATPSAVGTEEASIPLDNAIGTAFDAALPIQTHLSDLTFVGRLCHHYTRRNRGRPLSIQNVELLVPEQQ